jgi:hypothetical protein
LLWPLWTLAPWALVAVGAVRCEKPIRSIEQCMDWRFSRNSYFNELSNFRWNTVSHPADTSAGDSPVRQIEAALPCNWNFVLPHCFQNRACISVANQCRSKCRGKSGYPQWRGDLMGGVTWLAWRSLDFVFLHLQLLLVLPCSLHCSLARKRCLTRSSASPPPPRP